jgi:hypothetical protein
MRDNKERTNVTLSPEIKKAGLKYAEELGISLSAFISMRIADYKRKGEKK